MAKKKGVFDTQAERWPKWVAWKKRGGIPSPRLQKYLKRTFGKTL